MANDSPTIEKSEAATGLQRKYERSRWGLCFEDPAIETLYRAETLQRTLPYIRFSWGILALFVFVFALLDAQVFPHALRQILVARIALALFGVTALAMSFVHRYQRWLVYSAPAFILSMSAFSIFLLAQTDPETTSPYFASFFFAFCGVFITPGVGFRYSSVSIGVGMLMFALVFAFWAPVSAGPLFIYSVFVGSMGVIFVYVGYFTEGLARENYAISAQLRDSLQDVQQLSGLLPICASCKSIRDDGGYWSRLEEFIGSRSDAVFSHGLCPDCAHKLYPEFTRDPSG